MSVFSLHHLVGQHGQQAGSAAELAACQRRVRLQAQGLGVLARGGQAQQRDVGGFVVVLVLKELQKNSPNVSLLSERRSFPVIV
jgi:hypothetical protein